MSKIKEYFQGLVKESVIPQEPANYDAETLKIYIDHLESENKQLKRQISEMVRPPCKLGDILYIPTISFCDGFSENDEMTHDISVDVAETLVDRENYYHCCHLVDRQRAFFSKEAARKKLQEMKKSLTLPTAKVGGND